MKSGFTLIELMIAFAVITVLLMGGTLIFSKTIGSGGVNQAKLNVLTSSNQLLQAVENGIRFKNVVGVGSYTRDQCLDAGKTGDFVSDTILIVSDMFGITTYSISSYKMSSNSAVISSPNLKIKSVSFNWYCIPGSNDKIQVAITTNDIGLTASIPDNTFSRSINMYNSK